MESIWSESCKFCERDILDKDIKTDVAVIGAGMAGILTAYMLKNYGFDTVVIEADKIAGGVTQNTTAKITSQHNLIYSKLIKDFGEERAKQYAKANQLAIKKYKELIDKKNIDCEFEQKPAYVYSTDQLEIIEDEVKAANRLGLKAEFKEDTNLPFAVKGAIKFNNQAQFNPLKFIKPISEELTIYEHTLAKAINEDVIVTDRGNIKAKLIVVATHFPFMNNPGYYFMRMYQQRSYVLALENTPQLDGMYIDADEKGYSFRNYGDLLLLGGAGHRTGKAQAGNYEKLQAAANIWYPLSKEKSRWSAQDCMSLDSVPYIGHYSSATPTMFVATGFNKWGMTSSMVSSMIISDMICGKDNDYLDIFSPQRFNMTASIKTLVVDSAQAISGMVIKKLELPEENIKHIEKGKGAIIEYNGTKAGVYKDEYGKVFVVDSTCSHLGCQLEWNPDELSWDCPCHGSRFDYKGNLLNNPATRGINY